MIQSIAIYHQQFNNTSAVCLHIVKWSNISISNNSI